MCHRRHYHTDTVAIATAPTVAAAAADYHYDLFLNSLSSQYWITTVTTLNAPSINIATVNDTVEECHKRRERTYHNFVQPHNKVHRARFASLPPVVERVVVLSSRQRPKRTLQGSRPALYISICSATMISSHLNQSNISSKLPGIGVSPYQ